MQNLSVHLIVPEWSPRPEQRSMRCVLRILFPELMHLTKWKEKWNAGRRAAERGASMGNRESLLKYLLAIVLVGSLGLVWSAPRAVAASTTSHKVLSLSDQVHHELAMLPWYGVFDNLEYQVNGTEVVLKGQVISEHATTKDDAERFVGSIPGVTNVINQIEVLPPSQFDDQIRRAEYRTVFSKSDLGR